VDCEGNSGPPLVRIHFIEGDEAYEHTHRQERWDKSVDALRASICPLTATFAP